MGSIINGKELSNKILENLNFKPTGSICDLAIVHIGDDPASKVYMNNKRKACEKIGMTCLIHKFEKTDSYEQIASGINNLNKLDYVKGIILQLPIISDVLTEDEKIKLTKMISPIKDVDGFLTDSIYTPCTPKGILRLLDSVKEETGSGKIALVIGRSDIVGKPIAKLLLDRNYTVIQAHSKTPKERLLRMFSFSDVVISAVGKKDLLTEEDAYQYFKDNRHDFYGNLENKRDRIIIDVGINRDENGKLCGDFSESFKEKYSEYYTPVPGGVGPMTVAMLIENTYESITKKNPLLEAIFKVYKNKNTEELNW